MKNLIYIALCAVTLLTGCDKFLDVVPKGYVIPKTEDDFNLLLNGSSLAITSNVNFPRLSDDHDTPGLVIGSTGLGSRIATWEEQFTTDITAKPVFWSEGYANILYYNIVIDGIDPNTATAYGRSLRAEALLGRAYEYFYLNNLYGKPYSEANANTLGVPFVTSVSADDPIPARSTIKEVNERILEDIKTALPDLPNNNDQNRYRGSKQAGYSVMARIYLYMNDYENATKAAAMAVVNKEVLKMTELTPGGYYVTDQQPHNLYYRRGYSNSIILTVSLDLLKLYNPDDYRLKFGFSGLSDDAFKQRQEVEYYPWMFPQNTGTTVEEMKLIIAEAAARRGDKNTALSEVNEIMRYRIEDFTPYQAATAQDALKIVLNERRKELAFIGLRWFDMRRLSENGELGTVYRKNLSEQVIAELPAKSPKYTLQIPSMVQSFNPNMPINER